MEADLNDLNKDLAFNVYYQYACMHLSFNTLEPKASTNTLGLFNGWTKDRYETTIAVWNWEFKSH